MIRHAPSLNDKSPLLVLDFTNEPVVDNYRRVEGDTCLKDTSKIDPEFVSRFNDTNKTVLQESGKGGRMLREIRDVCAVRQVTMEKRYCWDGEYLMQVQFFVHNFTNKSVRIKFDPECTNGNVEFFRADPHNYDPTSLTLSVVPCDPHTKGNEQVFTIPPERTNVLCLVSERKKRSGNPVSMGFRFDYTVKKSWF